MGTAAEERNTAEKSKSGLPRCGETSQHGPHSMPTTIKISAQFATSLHSPEHIAIAEQLGYDRAWLFDTPHESPDVWMMLALAAERTTTIGLGPGVLVPTLRHPMVNASAAAALTALAPGRVAIAFGTGFAGARALGSAPASWSYLRDYVAVFRALLAGATVSWQGTRLRMMHPDGHAPARPIDVPILISALGPKGLAWPPHSPTGCSLPPARPASPPASTGPRWLRTAPCWPTVSLWTPARIQAAAEPGNAVAYHAAYEFGADVTALPAGDVWLDTINQTPPRDRHFAVHDQHLVALSHADTAAWAAGSWKAIFLRPR